MGNAQWLLELALLLLLAVTLFHAMRLERALGVLKRDRAVLEELVAGFNESTRQAETGIERLRAAADGAGRQMARQTDVAQRLRDDLSFLADRSDRLAERLEAAVRSARMFGDGIALSSAPATPAFAPFASQSAPPPAPAPAPFARAVESGAEADPPPVLRSQAERDLMRALRAGR
jgi:hypothetical protein